MGLVVGEYGSRVSGWSGGQAEYIARLEADLAQARMEARAFATAPRSLVKSGPTFREAADRYYREVMEVRRSPRSAYSFKSLLNFHLYPIWAEKPLADITKADIKAVFRRIGTTRTKPYRNRRDGCQGRANSAYWFLRKFFAWASDDSGDGEHLIENNPILGIKQPYPYYDRERILSDDEIRWFWQATGETGNSYATVARLLLLTGQRRSEIANMAKDKINRRARLLSIPIPATKSRRGHLVPLSDLALEILDGVPVVLGPLVFARTGGKILSSAAFYQINRRIHKGMVELCRAEVAAAGGDPNEANVPWFVFHDLRRTAATVMCQLGHPVEVVDKILNHGGGRSGSGRVVNSVTRVYCKYEFEKERAAALQDLGAYVATLAGADSRADPHPDGMLMLAHPVAERQQ